MNIDQLVLRRVMHWEKHKQRAEQAGQLGQHPAITISRDYGARGRAIGEQVAQRLGLNMYDKEIVEQIAERAQVRAQIVESVDDRLRARIANWVGEQFDNGYFTYSDYLRNLSCVLLTIAEQEPAVIVGRGANFILLPQRTLRVRAHAPLAVRVKRIAALRELSEKKARAKVLRVDAERIAFGRRHFDCDLSLAEHYDLTLNTASLDEALCVHLVVEAYERRFNR